MFHLSKVGSLSLGPMQRAMQQLNKAHYRIAESFEFLDLEKYMETWQLIYQVYPEPPYIPACAEHPHK